MITVMCYAKGQSFFTIIDDDANSLDGIVSLKELADQKNIKLCFAVIPSRLVENKAIIDSLLSFQEQGFQICNHSFTHNKDFWNNAKEEEILLDIEKSENVLDSLGFVDTDYLVYPFGRFDIERRQMMRKLLPGKVKLAFNSRGFSNDLSGFDRYYVSRFPVRKHDNFTIVKSKIDQAIASESWIVFMTHSSNSRDFNLQRIEDIIDYCLSKNMTCLTIEQANRKYLNDVPQIENNEGDSQVKEIFGIIYMHGFYVLLIVFLIISIFCLIYFRNKLKS